MLSPEVQIALNVAVEIARDHAHVLVTPEHLLSALLMDEPTAACLTSAGANLPKVREALEEFFDEDIPETHDASIPLELSAGTRRVISRALANAHASQRELVEGPHVVVAMFSEPDGHAAYFLEEFGLSRLDLVSYISHGWQRPSKKPTHNIQIRTENNTEGDESEDSLLQKYTTNLNEKAASGKIDKLIGREVEVERMIRILARRRKNNPVLVGEPGVGKTALAEGLARRIVDGDVPPMLVDAQMYSLEMGGVVAGTRYRGDFEKRLRGIIEELREVPNAILFIDEIHTILRSGAVEGGAMDAANLLKPALADGSIRCVGATTYGEYRRVFQKDEALNRRFQKIDVDEPTIEESIEILQGLMPAYAEYHHVTYLEDAIEQCVTLSARHIGDRRLPDKAVDLLDESGVEAKLRDDGDGVVTAVDVERVVARIAKIPDVTVTESERDRLKRLERDLLRSVFGQDQAITEVVNAVKLARSGLNEPEKPLGSFLFTGPTGVGKTEVARQLADTLGLPLIRFDMSEYSERFAVSRLIGASPGYVGYEQGGQLTEEITKNPNSVLLLDEIEKAHPEIYNILLQVMDHGTLTDNQGRKASFKNVILIMTSNVGARALDTALIGFSEDVRLGSDDKAYEAAFSPEFRNRLDARIRFAPLQPTTMVKIVEKFVDALRKQLTEQEVEIELTDAARDLFSTLGYDKRMGARPMARVIREKLKAPLAEEILFGKLQEGGHVLVDAKNQEVVFTFRPLGGSKEKEELVNA